MTSNLVVTLDGITSVSSLLSETFESIFNKSPRLHSFTCILLKSGISSHGEVLKNYSMHLLLPDCTIATSNYLGVAIVL